MANEKDETNLFVRLELRDTHVYGQVVGHVDIPLGRVRGLVGARVLVTEQRDLLEDKRSPRPVKDAPQA